MKASVAQWIGKREKQEDSYVVRYYPAGVLLIVCDGMGGHHHGAMASRTAAEMFAKDFEEQEGCGSVSERMKHALEAANAAVCHEFAKSDSYGGTTLVAAYISGGLMWWVSVGDSPLFLWRRRRLLRLNEDHSLRAVFMQYVKAGALSYDDAMQQGHRLRSALTGEPPSLIDAPNTPLPLLPGDRIILASDGADDLLLPAIMTEAVKDLLDNREDELPSLIVQACVLQDDPHADNVTVISVDWK